MLGLKLEDVDLRGILFTLYRASNEFDVPKEIAYRLLTALHVNLKGNEQSVQLLPEFITLEDIIETGKSSLEEFLSEELIKEADTGFRLTDKADELLKRSSEIQKELYLSGFSYCGGALVLRF